MRLARVWVTPLLLALCWTALLAALLVWSALSEREHVESLALRQARTFFRQVVVTRSWNAEHGGVYVLTTADSPPNPFLDAPDREILTVSGVHLTKVNPAYMTRQLADITSNAEGVRFRITGLSPIRPENRPDSWETKALDAFHSGGQEHFELVKTGVKGPLYRYMAPLVGEAPCIQCHGKYGAKVGDILGGISVSLPAEPLLEASAAALGRLEIGYGVIWLLGLLGLAGSSWQLARKRAQAEAANHMKSVFLANVSHDMRTPMQGLLGMNELLLKTPLDHEQRRRVETMLHCGRGLLELVNDLLDVSRLEAGRLILENKPFHLGQAVADTARLFAFQAETKGVRLDWKIDPALPVHVLGDAFRFKQILGNLISNAVKYTDAGEVLVQAEPDQRGQGWLRVTVSDTGPGVPPDMAEAIFDSFSRVDHSPSRRHEGSGLGLAIARQIVERMGGDIRLADPVPGKGAVFVFRAPLPAAREALDGRMLFDPHASHGQRTARPGRILLVEDARPSASFIIEVLRQDGHQVVWAEDGAAALDHLARESFDLVIMDMYLPDLDGLAVVKRLRSGEALNPAVPVVAATASVIPLEQLRRAGIDGLAVKPLSAEGLRVLVQEYMTAPTQLKETADGEQESDALESLEETGKRLGVKRSVVLRLYREFLNDTPMRGRDLERAVLENAWCEALRLAHAMKNSGELIGARQLAQTARDMECSLREDRHATARSLLPGLLQQIAALRGLLETTLRREDEETLDG